MKISVNQKARYAVKSNTYLQTLTLRERTCAYSAECIHLQHRHAGIFSFVFCRHQMDHLDIWGGVWGWGCCGGNSSTSRKSLCLCVTCLQVVAVGRKDTVRAARCCSPCVALGGTSSPGSSSQVPRSPPPCATHLLLHWFS